MRNEKPGAGCPSGCQPEKFPRENAIFGFPKRHIIIVWDGDKIAQIPIPTDSSDDGVVQLQTTEVIGLVEDFLENNNFMLSGLSLRIHSRDPATECVIHYSCSRCRCLEFTNMLGLSDSPNRHLCQYAQYPLTQTRAIEASVSSLRMHQLR